MKTVTLLGYPIESKIPDLQSILQNVQTRPFWIVTLNPEMIVAGERNPAYKKTLLGADARMADGVGVQYACYVRGDRVARYTGSQLIQEILDAHSIGVIAPPDALSAHADLIRSGMKISFDIVTREGKMCSKFCHAKVSPSVVFVTLGHPHQEQWISTHRSHLPTTKLIVGVGGALDFLTGRMLRAPKWMQKVGIEWLWRFWQEPRRWRRMIDALIIFPFVVMKYRLRSTLSPISYKL